MKEFDQVAAILDAKRLIIRVQAEAVDGNFEDEVYRVFARIDAPTLTNLDLTMIDIPKGRVLFVVRQAKDLWLAEVFNESAGKQKLEPQLSAFDRLRLSAERGLFSTNTSYQYVPDPPKESAQLDKGQAVGLQVSDKIQIGDFVAVWD